MKMWLRIVLIGTASISLAQTPAFEKNAELGRGINLGNMLEAPSETAWGNPFRDEYLEQIARLGFDHVRIPICWEKDGRCMEKTPYTIRPEFLQRIQHVVDLALKQNLQVIINMHHHDELMDDPQGQEQRFLSMWRQIAAAFSDYPDTLLFELLNEPHGKLTAEKWNTVLTNGIRVVRESDPSRFILIGVAEYGGPAGLPKLVIPPDDRVILTVHYYGPFKFTHQGASWAGEEAQGWLGTRWEGSDEDKASIQEDFKPVFTFSRKYNVPVHIGEFGAYSKADLASRARWTRYLARYFEDQGFSWAYWEYSAGFGIYDPSKKTYVEKLTEALLDKSVL